VIHQPLFVVQETGANLFLCSCQVQGAERFLALYSHLASSLGSTIVLDTRGNTLRPQLHNELLSLCGATTQKHSFPRIFYAIWPE
jgi:hypothetical protein